MADGTPTAAEVRELANRLRGVYTVPVRDGAGPLNGTGTFTREFQTPPIQHEAAKVVDAYAETLERTTWHPIATAPRDGTRVLIYGYEYGRHWFGTGYYFRGKDGSSEGWIPSSFYTMPNDSSGTFTPTHWQPMFCVPHEPRLDGPKEK